MSRSAWLLVMAFFVGGPGALAQVPPEVEDVAWCSGTSDCLMWTPTPGASYYHVYRGSAATLPQLLLDTEDSCREVVVGSTSTGSELIAVPVPNRMFWYVVSASNIAGKGTAGASSLGPRIVDPTGDCQACDVGEVDCGVACVDLSSSVLHCGYCDQACSTSNLTACQEANCIAGSCAVTPATTLCRDAVDVCDIAEMCDGVSPTCPADELQPSGFVCNAGASCDPAETCDGATTSCPPDTGVDLATCLPATPIVYNALHRTLTIDSVTINGNPTTQTTVTAGSSVKLALTGGWSYTGSYCPACITQFYARMNGVFSLCLGSATNFTTFPNASYPATITFTAPSTPGIYFINPAATWQYECVDELSVSTTFSSSTIATIVVP